METYLQNLTPSDILSIGIGFLLLIVGRRLYWLALGGVGFFAGSTLAQRFLEMPSQSSQLLLAIVAGIAGALLAIMAQKLAMSVAGFAVGALGSAWLMQTFAPHLEVWIAILALVGGIFGVVMADKLFDAALILVSSFAGAALLAQATHLGPPQDTWVLLGLFVVGLIAQSGGQKHRRRSYAKA